MKPKSRLLLVILCLLAICVGGCTAAEWEYYTCSECGSTREVFRTGLHREERILDRTPGFATCTHNWKPGLRADLQSWELENRLLNMSAVEPPISDGTIVLVRKGAAYGAFIPRNQKMTPETVEYDWYYRTDGKGTFKAAESPSFKSGKGGGVEGVGILDIKFGPFSIWWTGHTTGKGFIYYDRSPDQRVRPDGLRICVTGETDMETIDATDSKWVYKGSPSDPGHRLGEKNQEQEDA